MSTRDDLRFSTRSRGLKPSAIREILKVTETPDVISFAGGLPAPELFPVEAVARAAAAVLAEDGPASLQYGITEGHPPLRQWVSAHLREKVSLDVPPARILITSGSQQGLDLISKILIDPGDMVVVENPAYLGALQAFQAYEARVIGLPADSEGMDPEALRRLLSSSGPKPKFIYLVTNFQNPTGTSTSAGRRRELARLAAEFSVPVVEDNPYGSLRYSGEPAPALSSLPEAGTWLYLGTSSKIMAPGLRVAWVASSDPALHERLVTAKQATDLHTSSFTQRLVYHFVKEPGVLDSHVETLCRAYGKRRDAMLAALEGKLPPGCAWTRPEGGLFLWVQLPAAIDTLELLKSAGAQKVAFVPGAPFWVGSTVRNTLRLNFSNASEERIAEGIGRLGSVIRQALAG